MVFNGYSKIHLIRSAIIIFAWVMDASYGMDIHSSPIRQKPWLPSIMLSKVEGGSRLMKDPFHFEISFEVNKRDVNFLTDECQEASGNKLSAREMQRALIFRMGYEPDRKTGADQELLTYDENKMFEELFENLSRRFLDDAPSYTQCTKKVKISKDESSEDESGDDKSTRDANSEDEGSEDEGSENECSDEDYFESARLHIVKLNSAIPEYILNSFLVKAINQEKFISGLSSAIAITAKELKRKREEGDSITEKKQQFKNYRDHLEASDDFRINCSALVHGDEGVLTLELILQDIDQKTNISPLPPTLLGLRTKLQSWAVGKVSTEYDKKLDQMRGKVKSRALLDGHSGMYQ